MTWRLKERGYRADVEMTLFFREYFGLVTRRVYSSLMMTSSMEIFSALLALCKGNPLVAGGCPSQRPVTRSFDFFFICAWTNGWANNRDAGDLRRHRTRYDVIAMPLDQDAGDPVDGSFKNSCTHYSFAFDRILLVTSICLLKWLFGAWRVWMQGCVLDGSRLLKK